MKACFIFGGGTGYRLHRRPAAGDYIIAADAGYKACQREGIVPDLLLGDFDSLDAVPDFPKIHRAPVEKDDTDTTLAAKEGLAMGYREFHIYGGTGGKRLDHTLANLQLLLLLRESGARGYLYDDDFVFTAIQNETLRVPKAVEWGLLSVFCFGQEAHGIDEEGVQYPLRDASLSSAQPLGVSNHILAEEARVTVRDGSLIVGWELAQA